MCLSRLTSIYLASKAENYPLSLSKFCAQVNEGSAGKQAPTAPSAARGDVSESIIRDLEFGMVQSLDFELGVHGAHRALYGLILDFQTLENPLSRDDLVAFAAAVQVFVQCARLTDAEFIYAPPHIALAACWMCEAKGSSAVVSGKTIVQKWIAAKEKAAISTQLARHGERTTWRNKKRALDQSKDTSQAASEASELDTPMDYQIEDLKKSGALLPSAEMEQILDEIAGQIRGVAPGTPPGAPLKPQIDMEQVKRIDLTLRACLSLFEKGQSSATRKRSAQEEGGSTKRQRTDASVDSDDDL